ncbi:MAG TPA: preprotein translocase subunit YajC [Rhodopila sp.]|jgi:preprotein translocase subunit YajC|nr:preprotein translocase subunit YajC [Rhodopila sp.]
MSLFELIPSAYAQTTTGAAGGTSTGDMLTQFFPFILIIGIFYVLMIRPQQQKQKALQKQLSDLKRGDNVITSGGIIGTIARVVNDDEVLLDIAEGTRVRVVRSTITGITGKGEPRTDVKSTSDNAEDKPAAPRTARRGKPANESKPQA